MSGLNAAQFKNLSSPDDLTLGQTVRDRISGLTGIAASKVEYITGCTQFAVAQAGTENGKPIDWAYFDWQRLQVDDLAPNEFADVVESPTTQQRNGAGDTPPARY